MGTQNHIIERTPLIITALMLVIGTVLFIGSYGADPMADRGVYEGIRYKVAYAPTGEMKLFALADADELGKLTAFAGNSSPAGAGVVIGSAEAAMMQEEKLFSSVGDSIPGLFGLDITIAGVLAETGSITDDTHFVAPASFESLQGDEGVVYVKFTADGMPKHFYRVPVSAQRVRSLELAEGDPALYTTDEKDGVLYQPVIIGAKEAQMMREEKLFSASGDTIEGFFGVDVRIVGILEETGTALDMMHVIPLPSEALA